MTKAQNLSGQTFGLFKVLEVAEVHPRKGRKYLCECLNCGENILQYGYTLKKHKGMRAYCCKDLLYSVGDRFNRLTLLKKIGRDSKGKEQWELECDCGKIIIRPKACILTKRNESCGCLKLENFISMNESRTRHGLAGNKSSKEEKQLYKRWLNIRSRCCDPKNSSFLCYGGRGIKLCEEWSGASGAKNFVVWSLSHGYRKHLSIERIDVNGDYCPENCTWVTAREQAANKRNTYRIFIRELNKEMPLSEAFRLYGRSSYSTVRRRIENGWEPWEALTLPAKR